ncbi:unnamed protein product [Blepharisma stoltei]|uniref:Uncharacterized protein n=1 Tax=Blepharisma stoltei TaxID=1481888 RepID=A0AAU9IPW8_9CILI|nr:unnamed protein product [Blepharisma stoltei]
MVDIKLDSPTKYANHLEELRNLYCDLTEEIKKEESEKLAIFKEMDIVANRLAQIERELQSMETNSNNIDVIIKEISKGYTKIEASTYSLYMLASRQLKMLKRKFPL